MDTKDIPDTSCDFNEISSEWYFTADHGVRGASAERGGGFKPPYVIRHDEGLAEMHLQAVTICALVLRNGFVVLGQSACADHETVDADAGRKLARLDAVRQLQRFRAFRSRDRLQAEIDETAVSIDMGDVE